MTDSCKQRLPAAPQSMWPEGYYRGSQALKHDERDTLQYVASWRVPPEVLYCSPTEVRVTPTATSGGEALAIYHYPTPTSSSFQQSSWPYAPSS